MSTDPDRPSPEGAAPPPDLSARLGYLERLEAELVRKAPPLMALGASLSHADFFVLGATRRTLAQARGFRQLIEARNFPCAAAILRMQLDTAMRVKALSIVSDMHEACRQVLEGTRFSRLKDRSGKKLTDAHLREELARSHPWVSPVYEQASDFVHLSGRHFYSSIASTEDDTRIARFSISGEDPPRPESVYFEIVDTFFEATRLASMLILGYLTARTGTIALEPEGPAQTPSDAGRAEP